MIILVGTEYICFLYEDNNILTELGDGQWGVPIYHCRDGRIRSSSELRVKKEKFLTWILYLAYADDITLTQQGRKKFEDMVQQFFKVTEKFGITVSCEDRKTKAMRVSFRRSTRNGNRRSQSENGETKTSGERQKTDGRLERREADTIGEGEETSKGDYIRSKQTTGRPGQRTCNHTRGRRMRCRRRTATTPGANSERGQTDQVDQPENTVRNGDSNSRSYSRNGRRHKTTSEESNEDVLGEEAILLLRRADTQDQRYVAANTHAADITMGITIWVAHMDNDESKDDNTTTDLAEDVQNGGRETEQASAAYKG